MGFIHGIYSSFLSKKAQSGKNSMENLSLRMYNILLIEAIAA
jgi:hypothetical protein